MSAINKSIKETLDTENKYIDMADSAMDVLAVSIGELLNDNDKETDPAIIYAQVEQKIKECGLDSMIESMLNSGYMDLIGQSESYYKKVGLLKNG